MTNKNVNNTIQNEDELRIVYRGMYEDTPENSTVTVEEGMLEITENAFRDFEHLETVRLPRSVKKISAAAFAGVRPCGASRCSSVLKRYSTRHSPPAPR